MGERAVMVLSKHVHVKSIGVNLCNATSSWTDL